MIGGRYCKRCKSFYDIGTNFDICMRCRQKEYLEINKEDKDDGS